MRAGCCSSDTLLHIFTSGTTGLPKAARLNHIRFFSAIVMPYLFDLRASDRLYCCLPMCHTVRHATAACPCATRCATLLLFAHVPHGAPRARTPRE